VGRWQAGPRHEVVRPDWIFSGPLVSEGAFCYKVTFVWCGINLFARWWKDLQYNWIENHTSFPGECDVRLPTWFLFLLICFLQLPCFGIHKYLQINLYIILSPRCVTWLICVGDMTRISHFLSLHRCIFYISWLPGVVFMCSCLCVRACVYVWVSERVAWCSHITVSKNNACICAPRRVYSVIECNRMCGGTHLCARGCIQMCDFGDSCVLWRIHMCAKTHLYVFKTKWHVWHDNVIYVSYGNIIRVTCGSIIRVAYGNVIRVTRHFTRARTLSLCWINVSGTVFWKLHSTRVALTLWIFCIHYCFCCCYSGQNRDFICQVQQEGAYKPCCALLRNVLAVREQVCVCVRVRIYICASVLVCMHIACMHSHARIHKYVNK